REWRRIGPPDGIACPATPIAVFPAAARCSTSGVMSLHVPADALEDAILEALHFESLRRNRQVSEFQLRGDRGGRCCVAQPHPGRCQLLTAADSRQNLPKCAVMLAFVSIVARREHGEWRALTRILALARITAAFGAQPVLKIAFCRVG